MSILSRMQVPVFKAEGVQQLPRDKWRLTVTGLVQQDQTLTFDDLLAMPQSKIDCRLTSVSGWSFRATWDGVLWSDFANRMGVQPKASHAIFSSSGGYDTCVSLADLDHPRVLICHGVEGEPLEAAYGAPVRMIIPNLWGYKSCKWLTRIQFTDHMTGGYWENRGYPREAIIEPGITIDWNTRAKRKNEGGEILW